ncbi:MAG: FMN-binding glutamate synthase family protein, partial [Planctomycetota bacterium]
GGGFDRLALEAGFVEGEGGIDLSIPLNRRAEGPRIRIALPFYGGGMSYGSISLAVMMGRAMAAQRAGTFTCTGEGGYPPDLVPYADHVITQIATGLFGVREETIQRARVVEFKYAQGAKPGLGGHLLGEKNTSDVAAMREAVQGTSLFSPFPFHSVYSVEDHKKHLDWIKTIHPEVLVSVKVSTPGDVDMVAVGSYYAGANIIHLDGAYGGTGAAPDIAKKNIAQPIEYALAQAHDFLVTEGIREEVTLIASGGVRSPEDVLKTVALGADGVVIGTAELVAVDCVRCGNCERGRGCPLGIATTDGALATQMDARFVCDRLLNLYRGWAAYMAGRLRALDMKSIRALRGRRDLLRFEDGRNA